MKTKRCTKCKLEKNTDKFSIKKNGRLQSYCKTCISEYNKQYREKNKEKLKKYYKKWKGDNKEKCKEYDKKYREENLGRLREYNENYNKKYFEKHEINRHSKYWEENKNKIRARRQKNKDNENKLRNKRRNEKRKSDPLFKLEEGIRSSIGKAFRKNGYTKKSKTIEILDCSFDYFKIHLESKFESWMNWENKGLYNGELNYGWDIDHIIPISSANTEEELIELNHYTNLQPLCSHINRDIKKDN